MTMLAKLKQLQLAVLAVNFAPDCQSRFTQNDLRLFIHYLMLNKQEWQAGFDSQLWNMINNNQLIILLKSQYWHSVHS